MSLSILKTSTSSVKCLFALLCHAVLPTDGFEAFTHWIRNAINHSDQSLGCETLQTVCDTLETTVGGTVGGSFTWT